jgi:putative ABC transport system permease protein
MCGLAVAVGAVVSLVGVSQGFERSFLRLYNKRGADLVVQRSGGTMQLSSGVPEKFGKQIANLPGVSQVVAGLMDVVAFEQHDLFAVIVNGWTADTPIFDEVKILAGRRLQADDRDRVMIGNVLATNLGKRVADKLELYGEEFEVVGVFESFSVYENGSVFMLLEDLQRLMDRKGKVTAFVVNSDQPGNKEAVADLGRRIESLDPMLTAVATADFIKDLSHLRVTRAGAWVTSMIAVIIGVIGVLNTMIMSVFERSREIGTLRAIGWRKSRVMRLILCESVILSLGGAVLGTLLGTGAARLLGYWHATSGFIEGGPAPSVILQGFLMAVVVGLLGAAYPAFWAANLWPVDAMRGK